MLDILKLISLAFIFLLSNLDANIQIIKKENKDSNRTLLVIAGIHGNEPGSYFAASLLSSHYEINSHNLWIVPNLNKESILANKRAVHGDMNRKFSVIHKNDKDINIIKDIKKIILAKNVSLVLNLHDGHGFYRKEFQGNIFNPNAWGQTCVIDQCKLNENQAFGNLNEIASIVKDKLNKKLIQEHHTFDVRNTKTKFDDEQMQLSLTYFAVTNNKPAFAIESSKNLSSLSQKIYYQLLAIEEFMKIMDISYKRNFTLNENSIAKILLNYGTLSINGRILLNLSDIKKSLSFIPIKSKSNEFDFSHPLGNTKKVNGDFLLFIGNRKIASIKPQYFQMSKICPQKIKLELDGVITSIDKATDFFVNDDFKIIKEKNIRVNVIGFTSKNTKDESNLLITKSSLNKRFSLDKSNTQYRIELYKNNKFCSMSVVHFK
ncbi:MAG: M99 family carboxypeptidase catalytic domain-containing protein [Sulfurimonas sp.]|nr:M99 family carboxypeptidase catalytic domain-containing protein [Sulfurimonas sp.]MDQ7061592.1 M99 family carboxypeptidase catalytic domain-containing protein [Sulfurimonas sp.]